MPATAGRVRMPANNRVHSSAALVSHDIWKNAIGYDPYAPVKDDSKGASRTESEADPENAYANFQGLLALARITGSNNDEVRGACKKCGRVGHLTFQCRNFLSVKEEDPFVIQANVMAGLKKIKGSVGKMNGRGAAQSSEESLELDDESEIESSDSSEDSEMERIIAERYGTRKKSSCKLKSARKKRDFSDDEDSDSDYERRKRRGRSKERRSGKRSGSESDDEIDGRSKRIREKRRTKDESSDDEEGHRKRKSRRGTKRRRSHRYSEDSDDSEESSRWRKRKSRGEKRRRRSHRYSEDSDDSEESSRWHKRKSRGEKRRRRSHRYSEDSDDSEESPRWRQRKSRRARSHSDSDVSDSDDSRVGRHSNRSHKKSRSRYYEDYE